MNFQNKMISNKFNRLFFILIVVGLFTKPGFSQNNYSFKHIGINEGLSNNQINCIFKDSIGYVWIGTGFGLNRYDGNEFKVFEHSFLDPNSLIDNVVLSIKEDFNHNLIINTRSGYTAFDFSKEIFIYPINTYLKKINYLDSVLFLTVDGNKDLWVQNENKVCSYYSAGIKKWITLNFLPKKNITDIQSKNELVYVVYDDGSIFVFNKEKQQIINKKELSKIYSIPKQANTFHLFIDSDNNLWLYQEFNPNGIYYFNTKNQKWSYLNSSRESEIILSNNTVKDITEDNKKKIWIATDHGGITIYDKQTQTLSFINNEVHKPRSLIEKSIMCLYFDRDHILWAGSYKYGISYFHESAFKFEQVQFQETNSQLSFDNDINCFEEDLDGNLWVGSNNKGLMKIDNITQGKQIFQQSDSNDEGLQSNVIVSLMNDADNNLWIGTYQGGLSKYDGKKFTTYLYNEEDSNSISNNNVWDILQNDKREIWIATLGGGINVYNPKLDTFIHYTSEKELSSDYIMCLYETKNKDILIGTAAGLNIYNSQTGKFSVLNSNHSNTKQFSNQNVLCVFEDSRGLIWAGTREGLNVYNPQNDSLIWINKNTGLANNVIVGIEEDDLKNLWISTANGLSNIVLSIVPQSGNYSYTITNFDEKDGLQGKTFNERAIFKASTGELFFGGHYGFNRVLTNNIKYNVNKPKPVFTNFLLNNKPLIIDSLYQGRVILDKNISQTKELDLFYNENTFTIEFSALNFIQSEKSTYQYKLEGINENWISLSGKQTSVSYNNLAPGEYTFAVKAANNDGYWSEEPIMLKIIIKPPFWKSTLAYLIYSLLGIGILFSIIFISRKRMQEKFKLKEQRIKEKRNKELDEMKLRFFTNISHEFRTLISLIIIPLEKLLKKTSNAESKKSLNIVHRNAEKLLQLVNQILDHRKLEVQGHKLNLSTGNIVRFIKEICDSFVDMYKNKNTQLIFNSGSDELRMNFDEDKISKIMSNLLSNAYKFTPAGGQIDVNLNLINGKSNTQQLEVRVSDNGIGVAEKERERIFERFYQVEMPATKATGSGIGLHLSKEFVNMHGGKIWIEPNENKGSTLIFVIPVINGNITNIGNSEIHQTQEHKEEKKHLSLDEASSEAKKTSELKTILLVDDNEDFRIFLKENLSEKYTIYEAENGRKGFDLAIEKTPDLIISDVMMPEIDGYELCKMTKTDLRSSHIPVILLTARSANEHIITGLETGADDYITKPFNLDILLLRINNLLKKREEYHQEIRKKREIEPSQIDISSLDEQLIQKALKCVDKNMDNTEFSVEILSQEMGMSRVHLYKKLLSITGKTPIEFIRILRLKRAAQLLEKSQLSISEIAYKVGFNTPKYFSRYFKKEFGVLPSAYAASFEIKK